MQKIKMILVTTLSFKVFSVKNLIKNRFIINYKYNYIQLKLK